MPLVQQTACPASSISGACHKSRNHEGFAGQRRVTEADIRANLPQADALFNLKG